ncbi:serine hydrolase domain-containing protein [Streptomyces sp. DSM 44917]|uniref:Serine hydrolase domain-containing protein n=1 Tax=Streptomyces boetiae TaxID=3075541 RepID=A0ABU2L1P3_9ACTN|nr:serine hydrolase domain-containing protein [Streptomyces sp. DSM 44917]MDT0305476.1 serine hydrolase domain-containing protein [Streptomyces sp. DSM 44917]
MKLLFAGKGGRTGWTRLALALAGVGAVGTATLLGVGPGAQVAPAAPAARGDGGGQLARDARAVERTGATAVLAETAQENGRGSRARAGTQDTPAPYDSYYRIGSDTKTFTAVVALQLVGEGTLSLSDTVEEWLPGLVSGQGNDGSRITLRHLLQHTSGLPNYTDVLFEDPDALTPEAYRAERFRVRTPAEQVALAMTRRPGWLPAPDETRWAYSNTNYVLAGMIIEAATGHTWEREVHERIIEPLGLARTLTPGTSAYVPQPTAPAWTQFPGREDLTDTTVATGGWADGGIISTTGDMNTFLRALLGGRLLAPDLLAEMQRTVPAEDFASRPGSRYGLGLAWRPAPGCPDGLWFHGGSSFGTISETAVTPDATRSAAAAVFTYRIGAPGRQHAQNEATYDLIENALCD